MFALLEVARIYKALKRLADLQGPICYNDAQNKEMNLSSPNVLDGIFQRKFGGRKLEMAYWWQIALQKKQNCVKRTGPLAR